MHIDTNYPNTCEFKAMLGYIEDTRPARLRLSLKAKLN